MSSSPIRCGSAMGYNLYAGRRHNSLAKRTRCEAILSRWVAFVPNPALYSFQRKAQLLFILRKLPSMAESTPDILASQIDEETAADNAQSGVVAEQAAEMAQSPVIWTPRFIVIFALILVIALSASSPLTQGWLNSYYPAGFVYLGYMALIFGSLIALLWLARSPWVRLGAVFGCVWALMTSIGFALNLLSIDTPPASIAQHLHAATYSALLGTYICFSMARAPMQRWDSWFFRLAPISGGVVVMAFFVLAPAELRSFDYIESSIALVALYLSALIWWVRPSNWQTQPGPTVLFGVIPILLLIFTVPNAVDDQTRFFLTQILLLCFLLGSIRMLQGEIQY